MILGLDEGVAMGDQHLTEAQAGTGNVAADPAHDRPDAGALGKFQLIDPPTDDLGGGGVAMVSITIQK